MERKTDSVNEVLRRLPAKSSVTVTISDKNKQRKLTELIHILRGSGCCHYGIVGVFASKRYLGREDILSFTEFCFNRMMLALGKDNLSAASQNIIQVFKHYKRGNAELETYLKLLKEFKSRGVGDPMWPLFLWADIPETAADCSHMAAVVRRHVGSESKKEEELKIQYKFLYRLLKEWEADDDGV